MSGAKRRRSHLAWQRTRSRDDGSIQASSLRPIKFRELRWVRTWQCEHRMWSLDLQLVNGEAERPANSVQRARCRLPATWVIQPLLCGHRKLHRNSHMQLNSSRGGDTALRY